MDLTFHHANGSDLPFLRAMLFEAAYWRNPNTALSIDDGLALPELAKLLAGWGRPGDCGIIATTHDGEPIGAAWYRFWTDDDHSYGYVSSEVPELAIAVAPSHRGIGIGRALLKRLKQEARDRGVDKLSLSVERDNPARALYESEGFVAVGTVGNADTMVWTAQESTNH